MPKIPNWSRLKPSTRQTVAKWKHDEKKSYLFVRRQPVRGRKNQNKYSYVIDYLKSKNSKPQELGRARTREEAMKVARNYLKKTSGMDRGEKNIQKNKHKSSRQLIRELDRGEKTKLINWYWKKTKKSKLPKNTLIEYTSKIQPKKTVRIEKIPETDSIYPEYKYQIRFGNRPIRSPYKTLSQAKEGLNSVLDNTVDEYFRKREVLVGDRLDWTKRHPKGYDDIYG